MKKLEVPPSLLSTYLLNITSPILYVVKEMFSNIKGQSIYKCKIIHFKPNTAYLCLLEGKL